MLIMTILDFLLRGIPEALLLIMIIQCLGWRFMRRTTFFLTAVFYSIATYLIRLLPINFGVHTILNIILLVCISAYIIQVPVVRAILYSLVDMALLSISEMINVFILIGIFKVNIESAFKNIPIKDIYGFPSMLLLLFFAFLFYFVNRKKHLHLPEKFIS